MRYRYPLLFIAAALAPACSVNRIAETYDSHGGLQQRSWQSHQFGTIRQASLSMQQTDGSYNIAAGESARSDSATAEILRVPLDAALAYYSPRMPMGFAPQPPAPTLPPASEGARP